VSNRIYYSREAEAQANQEKALMVGIFLLLGLGIGAALALLFAPRSGQKTRQELTRALEERFATVEKDMENLRHSVEERMKERR
jgi:gas vesicle protein